IPADVAEALDAVDKSGIPLDGLLIPANSREMLQEKADSDPTPFSESNEIKRETEAKIISIPFRRKASRFLVQVGFAILFCMSIGLVARHWESVRSWGAFILTALPQRHESQARSYSSQESPSVSEPPRRPFVSQRTGTA